jgi:hypothetical protein
MAALACLLALAVLMYACAVTPAVAEEAAAAGDDCGVRL